MFTFLLENGVVVIWLKDATPDGILYIENMFGGFGCWVGEFALFWVFPLIS